MSTLIPNTLQYPNFYVDELMHLLSPEENVVLMFATRQILGWKDTRVTRRARISVSVFCEGYEVHGERVTKGTGLSRGTVIECLDTLCKYGILLRVADSKKHDPRGQEFEINFDPFQIDLAGLRKRLVATDELNSRRVVQATQALNDKKITSLSDDISGSPSDDITTSLSDGHIERKKERNIYIENQEETTKPTDDDDLFAEVQAPLPATPRTKEQIKEGIRNAITDYAKSGGKKRGVADPHLAQTDKTNQIAEMFYNAMDGRITVQSAIDVAKKVIQEPYDMEWIERTVGLMKQRGETQRDTFKVYYFPKELQQFWAAKTSAEEKIWDFSN